MEISKWYAAIDLHSCGEPLRVITSGLPYMQGTSIRKKSIFFEENHDFVRKLLMAEPRGHYGMTGAVFTPPVTEEAHFGLFFLNNAGLSPINAHGIIAAVTAWIETGQLTSSEAERGILIDCPTGRIRIHAAIERHKVHSVTIQNVPSYVHTKGIPISVQGMIFKVDIAYSGAFYATVDIKEFGGLKSSFSKLHSWGEAIGNAIELQFDVTHPELNWLSGIHGVFFYDRDDLSSNVYHSTTVVRGEQVGRSPGGAGICAHLAVMNDQAILDSGQQVIYEGITGTCVSGEIAEKTFYFGKPAVVPQLIGNAYVIGLMNFVLGPTDPLTEGFVLS